LTTAAAHRLIHSTFRASPQFELKQFSQLTPAQREALHELELDRDFYGLLVPRPPSTANIKSVGHDVAEIFRLLSSPAPLPVCGIAEEELLDLILDGVLEIEDDGEFVCGADFLPLIGDSWSEQTFSSDPLSLAALEHAEDLQSADAGTLTMALYLFHRIPISNFWKRRFADRVAVLAEIGADKGTVASILASSWQAGPPSHSPGWVSWHALDRPKKTEDEPTYKLYVSARPENIRDAFQALVYTLADSGAADFKIGEDAAGLLRPDKLVAYFRSREQLDDVAARLLARLAGCPAHGVPFTALIDPAGLLSWGLDPPDTARALSWLGRESWRLWLATQLGTAIAFAKTSSRRSVAHSRFALERVRRLGVDVTKWTPGQTLWR
jgi:hypothetical protein